MKSLEVCSWPRVHIPDACRNVEIVIGIDEAGRGPVLGSLVYCAAFWPVSEHEAISKLGFDDSKQLKEGERDRLFDRIRAHPSIGWVIEEITAQEISEVTQSTIVLVAISSHSQDKIAKLLLKITAVFLIHHPHVLFEFISRICSV